jgi:hypothetical protein
MEDPYDRVLANSILGTADPHVIYAALGEFCRTHFEAELADITYCSLSIGAGFGLTLDDGRRMFLKAWSPKTSTRRLDAIHVVQHALASEGFPAPDVLMMPKPFMAGHATVMQWLDLGEQEDASRPQLRRAMAASLAELITLASAYAELPELPRHSYPENGAWGSPHNALFDFEGTSQGAEWIDEIALASAHAARLGEGRIVLGHGDWSTKNVRFARNMGGAAFVSAVYDWDSLILARESEIVGMAAATFTVTWDIPIARVFPHPADMAAFVADYEEAAGRVFTPNERRTADAAATYVLAYTARCEHCTAVPGVPDSELSILLRQCASTGGLNFLPDRGSVEMS